MRELVIELLYRPQVDPVMDIFIENERLMSKTVNFSVTSQSLWRIDRITGPAEALNQLEERLFNPTDCNECLTDETCSTEWDYEVLSSTPTSRTVYTHGVAIEECHSVPHLAMERFGTGLLFEAKRQDNRYTWRVLSPAEIHAGPFYESLSADLKDGIDVQLTQLSEFTEWEDDVLSLVDLPYEQRHALEIAVEQGYYETPREINTAELADHLDIPRSTLQYRLQRAEAWVAKLFADTP